MGGADPAQKMQSMQNQAQQNYDAADSNQDGVVSSAELLEVLSTEGIENSKAQEFVGLVDADGDGNISQSEHQKMLQEAEDRMSNMMAKMEGGPEGYSAMRSEPTTEFEALKTMMSTMAKDTKDAEGAKSLNTLLEQLESEGYSKEGVQNSMELLNKVAPPINTMV